MGQLSISPAELTAGQDPIAGLREELKRADACMLSGRFVEAREIAEQCWHSLGATDEHALQGDCQRLICWSNVQIGQVKPAVEACYRAVTCYEKVGDLAGVAAILSLGAIALARIGESDECLAMLKRAYDLAHDVNDAFTRFRIFNNMGMVYEVREEFDKAVAALQTALMIAKSMNRPHAIMHAETSLYLYQVRHALHLRDTGSVEEAMTRLDATLAQIPEHLEHCRFNGNGHMLATLHHATGMGLLAKGDLKSARQALTQGIDVASVAEMIPEHANMLHSLAEVESQEGDQVSALELLGQALLLSEMCGEREIIAKCRFRLSKICERMGRWPEALVNFQAFHDIKIESLRIQAATRAQVLAIRLDQERTRLEVEMFRIRSAELERHNVDLQAHAAQLDLHANEDALTKLANRRRFDAFMAQFQASGSGKRSVTFAIADIDHFKRVNDGFSHVVGDLVLRQVGALFREQCRPKDLVARFGGEEFVMVLVDADQHQAVGAAERLRAAIEAFDWASIQPGLHVTISVGVAHCESTLRPDETLARADAALYAAKREGRNRVHVADDCGSRSLA